MFSRTITPRVISRRVIRLYSQLPLRVPVTLPNGLKYEQPTGLFINGDFVPSKQNKIFEVINPSTEEVITPVYEAMEDDVDIAVAAAKKAFKSWSIADPEVRASALFKLANLVEKNAELLASIETADNGKSLLCSRGDVALVSKYLRSCGGWADKINGNVINTGDNHFAYTTRAVSYTHLDVYKRQLLGLNHEDIETSFSTN